MNERIHDEPPPFAKKHFPPLFRVRGWADGPQPIFDVRTTNEDEARERYALYAGRVRCGKLRAAQLGDRGFLIERTERAK